VFPPDRAKTPNPQEIQNSHTNPEHNNEPENPARR